MLILSLLSLVISERVKIASKRNPAYFLTILEHSKGYFVRLMKENDIHNPAELSGFDVSGNTTELNNNGVSVCVNGWKTDIITCLRNSGEKIVFNVIRTAKDVTFKTNEDNCLTMGNYDPITNGYHLKLYGCKNDDGKQKFILMNMTKVNEPKTPPAAFPNSFNNDNPNASSTNATNGNATPATFPNNINNNPTPPLTNEINGNATSKTFPNEVNYNLTPAPTANNINGNPTLAQSPNISNSNSQNNATGTSSNIYMPNILFVPVSLDQNNAPGLTKRSQLNGGLNPFCFDTNQLAAPTSLTNVYKFRRPAQLGNECNNHLQWTYTFRQLY